MFGHLAPRFLSRPSLVRNHRNYSSVTSASAVTFNSFGAPENVLKIQNQTAVSSPGSNEVVVKMLAAPINPADLNLIEGSYGISSTLPAVGGTEGVGVVVGVGSGVKDLKVGDHVIPAKPSTGTWRTVGVFPHSQWMSIPKDIPKEYAATISNPSTALRLLEDFVKLKPGDVVIQNGANSMVGTALLQLAKSRSIKTINIIRQRKDFKETVERLKALGGFHVVPEEFVGTAQFRSLLSDLPPPSLALNAVGGPSATEMARTLKPGGTMVTYGGLSRRPVTVPTSSFIFRDIHLRGFWLTQWLQEHSEGERRAMLETLFQLIRQDSLKLWMETWQFDHFFKALARHKEPQRDRKVVLVMPE